MMEIWKDVKNFSGLYKISNLGRVYSVKSKRIMQNRPNKIRGYVLVSISFDGIVKKIPVHRLVAEAFIPNPEKKPEVNHIDGNKANNNVENLEWATKSENILHSKRILHRKGRDRRVWFNGILFDNIKQFRDYINMKGKNYKNAFLIKERNNVLYFYKKG